MVDLGPSKVYPPKGMEVTLVNAYAGTEVPCTVLGRGEGGCLLVVECELVFEGPRYYNSYPCEIRPATPDDDNVRKLFWQNKGHRWAERGRYGRYADFGRLGYEPYLD